MLNYSLQIAESIKPARYFAVGVCALILAPASGHCSVVADTTMQPLLATILPVQVPRRSSAVIAVPLMLEDQPLGDVTVELALDSILTVAPVSLADALGSTINIATQEALRALGDSLVPIDQVKALGLDLQLNPQTLTVTIRLALPARGTQTFTASSDPQYSGMARISPSHYAFGLTAALLANSDLSSTALTNASTGLSGFLNIGGERGFNLVGSGTLGISGLSKKFQRDRVIAFVDRPESALRYSIGDLVPTQSRLAGSFDLLGASIERNYGELQPTRNIRPLGNRSFRLERRSTVEVYSNGILVQSFVAEPGPIDLRGISSLNLSSNVSIVVQDSLGRREIDSFNLANDITLLGQGIKEFSFSAGVLRNRFSTTDFGYSSDPVGSAYYSRGISETVTLSGSLVASGDVQNAGLSVANAIFGGVQLAEFSGSQVRDLGTGLAAGLSYRGDPLGLAKARNANLNLRLFYQTSDYRNLSDFSLSQSIKIDSAIDYRFNITRQLSINFGGNYYKQYGVSGFNRAFFVGVQRNIGRVSVSVTGRYLSQADGSEDLGAFISLSRPLGRRLNATATADSATGRGRFEVRKTRSLEFPEIEYAINTQYGPQDKQLGGNFSYATSRFESDFTVAEQFDERGTNQSIGMIRLQSGLAFVDGHVGIGRDTGQGFVMVARHKSLKNAQIKVTEGAAGRTLGFSNRFGPAVIPIDNGYRPVLLRMNGINLPEGYDIGSGDYVALPGARSGILIEVGSDAFHSVIATLQSRDGKPLSLISGRLRSEKTGKISSFFTNRTGRAVFTMLAPGRYGIEVDGLDETFFFEVADDAETLKNLGTVRMGQSL